MPSAPTCKPTLAPSAKPSTSIPSAAPSTGAPTAPFTSCTRGCTFLGGTPLAIAANQELNEISLPTLFKLQFSVFGPTIAASSAIRKNMIDIVDYATGVSLFSVCTTENAALQVNYGGVTVAPYSVDLVSNYASAFTYLTFTVQSYLVSANAAGNSWTPTYAVASNVNTTGRVYNLYISNPTQTTTGGSITNIIFTRK